MDRKHGQILVLTLIIFTAVSLQAAYSLSPNETLKKIVAKAQQNEKLAEEIGFHQVTVTKKMKDGKLSSENVRLYRTAWVEDQPYMELIQVDGKDLNQKEKKQEAERKAKFLKSLHEKKDKEESVTWDGLYSKYDFQSLPADSMGRYVFSFKPKPGKLQERSKSEKVLNHVKGTLWADEEFNIVRAEAKLLDNVRFGLGILGNLEKFELKFEQQDYQNISVPSNFYVHFKARVALLKTEERQIQATYKDFFRRQQN
jgi:hypothetical protein